MSSSVSQRGSLVDYPRRDSDSSPTIIPDLPNSKRDAKTLKVVPKKKGDTPKILELVGKGDILGMVTYDNDILLVYEGGLSLHLYVRRLTLSQTSGVSWTKAASPLVQVIMLSGSVEHQGIRVTDRTCCYSLPDTSRCAASIRAN